MVREKEKRLKVEHTFDSMQHNIITWLDWQSRGRKSGKALGGQNENDNIYGPEQALEEEKGGHLGVYVRVFQERTPPV